jgi:predicted metal-dependent phosphotriesterase family hydrolase
MRKEVMTVLGPVDPGSLGLLLPHEHVMSTFGLPAAPVASYDEARLLPAATGYLRHLKELGCGAVADCTTAYFGRDPSLLARISEASGVAILTNTGYYAAAGDRYVPEHAFKESAAQIAARWTAEWRDGIGGTGIRPGFIKTAVDEGPLSDIDRKLVRAAILTHMETGLTVQTHVGDNPAVVDEILGMLGGEGISPEAWIWVHAHAVREASGLRRAAEAGAWISLDGLGEDTAAHILGLLQALRDWGLLGRALVSHDGEAFDPSGGSRQFHVLLTSFIPLMERSGFDRGEIEQVTVRNPAQAFTPGRAL